MNDLVSLLATQGPAVVFLVTLAARLGAPVPAVPFLVVAGGLAVGGTALNAAAIVVASLLGNLLGDGAWFLAGRRWGYGVMRLLCRVSLSADTCVSRSESILGRWGGLSLIAAKYVPGVSVVAPPMAGALGMSVARFIGYDTGAALVWTGVFLGLGWVFRDQIQEVLAMLAQAGGIATLALVVVLGVMLALRYARRRAVLRLTRMPRISVDELHQLLASDAPPLVIDVRGEAGVKVDPRRIPGALSYTLKALQQRKLVLPLDGQRDVVLYCNCPNEVTAAMAARVLLARGARRAWPLTGGLDAWVASGHPTSLH